MTVLYATGDECSERVRRPAERALMNAVRSIVDVLVDEGKGVG